MNTKIVEKKTGIVIFLALITAFSAYGQSPSDFRVIPNSAGDGVIITKYTGRLATVQIPYQIDEMPVKEIGERAFAENRTIANIRIPNTVTTIGDEAFALCGRLRAVAIPSSVTSIGKNAFEYTGIISATLSKNLTSIGEGAFYNCIQLRSIEIPEGVTVIPNSAFGACAALTEVRLPSTIQTIEEHAFQACMALTAVIIPRTVEKINFGRSAFGGCTKLNPASQTRLKQLGYN